MGIVYGLTGCAEYWNAAFPCSENFMISILFLSVSFQKFFSSAVVVREVDANEYNAACRAGPDSETFELSGEFVPIGDIDFAMFP